MIKKPIFTFGKNYLTAIELGKSYLKIAQAEVSGQGLVISKLIAKSVLGLSDEEISRALADIISTNNVKLDRLIAVISRERAMVRYVRLPAIRVEEISRMVSFEATRQIPYSREEVIYDYEIIATDSEGYSEIMLVIVHKNELARINNILSPVRKEPLQVRLSSEAVSAWLKAASGTEPAQKNICLLDVDRDSTEIAVISGDKLEFSRVASIGVANISQDESEADFWKGRLIDELKRSIGMYVKERGKEASAIEEFLITGANSVIEDLSAFTREQMGIASRALNVLSTLTMADQALPDEGLSADCSVCSVCGGLFLSEGVNLIPAELRRKQKSKAKTRKLAAILLSVVAGAALLSVIALARLYQKEQLLMRLDNMLKQIESTTMATEDKLKKLRVVKKQLSEGATSLDVIYHLYRLIPANISLIDFDYEDKDRVVRFRGTAVRMSDVFNLATILEKSDRFGNVQTGSVSKRQTREGELVDFQFRCNFE